VTYRMNPAYQLWLPANGRGLRRQTTPRALMHSSAPWEHPWRGIYLKLGAFRVLSRYLIDLSNFYDVYEVFDGPVNRCKLITDKRMTSDDDNESSKLTSNDSLAAAQPNSVVNICSSESSTKQPINST